MNKPDTSKTAWRVLTHLGALILCTSAATAAVEISAKPTSNMTCSAGVCSPTAKKAVLNVNDLAGMLASGDVKVTSGAQAQDIEIDAVLSWTSAQRLTLDSYHSITFNRPVVVAGNGALTINTNDGGSTGDFQFVGKGHVELWDLTSSLVINGRSYILIKNLRDFRQKLHNGESAGSFFALPKSLNVGRFNFNKSPLDVGFEGTFEGLGNTIAKLTILDDAQEGVDNDVGLFNEFGGNSEAVIRDLILQDVNVKGVSAGQQVGALVGRCISNCSTIHVQVSGQVSATKTESRVGGLMGSNQGLISECFSTATVTAGDGAQAAGGLVGQNNDGFFGGLIDRSYSTGPVSAGSQVMAGGLVGYNLSGAISNSYATGSVNSGSDGFAGGLIGANVLDQTGPTSIIFSYSTGQVGGGSGATVGGFIGEDLAQTGTANAYWDLDTSGISDPSKGAGNITNDPGITGLTDAQLKAALPSGFDKKVWAQKASINSGYPYLIAYPPPN